MPRKIFQTAKFTGGMILNADPSDLPDGFGVASLDTMSSLDSGVIGGRYADGPADGFNNVVQYTYFTNGVSYFLAYLDLAGAFWIDGVLIDADLAGRTITGHRNYVLIGCGSEAKTVYYGYPFGAGTPVNCPNDFNTNIITAVGVDAITSNSTVVFENGRYLYAYSVVYDGYIHGPLKECHEHFAFSSVQSNGSGGFLPYNTQNVTITLSVTEGMDAGRISKVILYRSTEPWGLESPLQASEYINVVEFTDLETMVFIDENKISVGSTYPNDSGLDETIKFCSLDYNVAYEMNNFLFVGNVGYIGDIGDGKGSVQQIPDGARILYRSLRGRHGQFKIIDDYVALPFSPIAITSFNKRLLVFGSAEFAVIDPESMTVEELLIGYGLESPLCVYSTFAGVFFANSNNMYVYDGARVIPIGDPVMRSWDAEVVSALTYVNVLSYEQIVATGGIINIIYSPRINSILFLYAANSATFAYVFSLDTRVWSVASFGSASAASAYVTRSNVLYIGNQAAMASQEKVTSWKYITGRYAFGASSQLKKIYKIILSATNQNAICQASFDSGEFIALDEQEVPTGNRVSKTVMIKFDPNEIYATYLSSIEIVYRELHVH